MRRDRFVAISSTSGTGHPQVVLQVARDAQV